MNYEIGGPERMAEAEAIAAEHGGIAMFHLVEDEQHGEMYEPVIVRVHREEGAVFLYVNYLNTGEATVLMGRHGDLAPLVANAGPAPRD